MEKRNSFWADARGQLNIFTVIAALAGLTVVSLPWAVVFRNYPNPERLDTLAYANFFLVAACILTDAALGMVMENGFWKANKAPDAVNLQTGDGATINQAPAEGGIN